MTKIKEVTNYLESIAPLHYQEDYDNAGLIYGNPATEVEGVLCSLDCTEDVVDEAIEKGCNMIVSHHPLVFGGIEKFKKGHWVSDTLIKAIKNEIAIYAIHTNLDNVMQNGVNEKIADILELSNCRILSPKKENKIIRFWVSELLTDNILEKTAQFANLQHNYFETNRNDRLGSTHEISGKSHEIESLMDTISQYNPQYILKSEGMKSPEIGAGIIGELDYPMPEKKFLEYLLGKMSISCIKHTKLQQKSVSKIALCGGAGRFLLETAIGQGADFYISSDFKYHDFFEANDQIVVADIGHFESEQYTIDLLISIIKEKFSTFAVHFTELSTNPVNYYGKNEE